jgi:hypothetical protein
LATGDSVIDGRGETLANPLSPSILVATYEKYIAMLSASGVHSSMINTVIVCDEIQLIGDKSRGQNVKGNKKAGNDLYLDPIFLIIVFQLFELGENRYSDMLAYSRGPKSLIDVFQRYMV